jgi:hypothetical protein
MKLKLLITIICISFLIACGGGKASTNSANSNVVKSENSNSAANQTTPAVTDSAPVTMDRDAFDKADTKMLEGYKGRTMIVKGGSVIGWSEDKMTLLPKPDRYVWCNGDFSSYSDSIKLYSQGNKYDLISADVKGTVKEIEERSGIIIKLENCTLLKLDK